MKKVKFILPALAFVVAAIASLATVNAKGSLLVNQDVSLPSPSACSKVGTCTVQGEDFCNNGTVDVIKFNSGGTCGAKVLGTYN